MRVGVLFSTRTDLARSLVSLAAADPHVTLAVAASDRTHDEQPIAPGADALDFPTARYRNRADRDIAMAEALLARDVGLVVTAGWLWLLSPGFLDRFPNRVVNVHPTLLPAFPGRHSVEAAVSYGVHIHGVTVHLVDEGIDTGPILAQAARPFPVSATAGEVRRALVPIERQQLGEVVRAFADDRVQHDPTTGRWSITPV